MSCVKSKDLSFINDEIQNAGIGVTEVDTGIWMGSPHEVDRLRSLLEAHFPMLVQAPRAFLSLADVRTEHGMQRQLTLDIGRLRFASIANNYDWPVPYDAADDDEVGGFLASYMGSLGFDVTTEHPATGEPMNTLSKLRELASQYGPNPNSIVLGWLAHPESMPPEALIVMIADRGFMDVPRKTIGLRTRVVGHRTATTPSGTTKQIAIERIDYDDLIKRLRGPMSAALAGVARNNSVYSIYREALRRLKRYSIEDGLYSYRTRTPNEERMYVSMRLGERAHMPSDLDQLAGLFHGLLSMVRKQIDIYKKLHDKDRYMRYARMLRLLERLEEKARPEVRAVIAINQMVHEMNWHLRVLTRMQALPPADPGTFLRAMRDAYLFASMVQQTIQGIQITGVLSKETRQDLEEAFNWLSSSADAIARWYRTDGYDIAASFLMEGAEGYVEDVDELKRVMLEYRDSAFDPVLLGLNLLVGSPATTANRQLLIFQRYLSEQYGRVKQAVNAIVDELEQLNLDWWAYEKEGGKLTGWLVTPKSWRRWRERRNADVEAWALKEGLPAEMKADEIFNFFSVFDPLITAEMWPSLTSEERYKKWSGLRTRYVNHITVWHMNNSQVRMEAIERIRDHLRQVQRDYGEDLSALITGVSPRRILLLSMPEDELRRRYPRSYAALIDYRDTIAAGDSTRAYGIYEPGKEYDNPQWNKLTQKQKDAVMHLIALRRRLDRLLPYGFGNEYAVPNVREGSQVEMIVGRSTQEMDEAIRRSLVILTPDGREVLAPPIYYSRIPDEPERLAHPLFAYASYAHMVFHYAMMGHARLAVETTEDVIQHQEGQEEAMTTLQKASRDLVRRFIRIMKESALYDIGYKPIRRSIDLAADIFNMMSVLAAFALKPVPVAVLFVTSQLVTFYEALRFHYYGIHHLMRAIATYTLSLPSLVIDAFRWGNQSKVQRFIRYSDVMMSYQHRLRRDRRFIRSVSRGGFEVEDILSAASGLHTAEHLIGGIFALSLGFGTKAIYDGKEYSVYQLMDASGNFPDGATFKSNGRPLTQATWSAYVQRAHAVVHASKGETHANLSRRNKVLGSFLLFRSWVAPMFLRFYGPEYYDGDVNALRSSLLYTWYKLAKYIQYLARYGSWQKVGERLKDKRIAQWDKTNTTAILETMALISVILIMTRAIAWFEEFFEKYGVGHLNALERALYAVIAGARREQYTMVDPEQWMQLVAFSGPIRFFVHLAKAIGSVVSVEEAMQGKPLFYEEKVGAGPDKGLERWRAELRKAFGTTNLSNIIEEMEQNDPYDFWIREQDFRYYRQQ